MDIHPIRTRRRTTPIREGTTLGAITVGTSALGGRAHRSAADELIDAMAILRGPFALVDTSNAYAGGRSEQILGRALAELGDVPTAGIVTRWTATPQRARSTGTECSGPSRRA
jgi:D-threo-aldose 1-dehydrogenase